MTLRIFPRSAPGRVALLSVIPVPGLAFGTILASPAAGRTGAVPYVLAALFFLAQVLFLAWRMRSLEEQLGRLKRPGKPSLFAHTVRSTLSAGILFAMTFSMTYFTSTTLFPKADYGLVILVCAYTATAVALVAGFLLSAADQLMPWQTFH